MKIIANGTETVLEKEATVRELLTILKVEMPEYVTVQLNDELLVSENFDVTVVKDGDVLEFLYYMGGGAL